MTIHIFVTLLYILRQLSQKDNACNGSVENIKLLLIKILKEFKAGDCKLSLGDLIDPDCQIDLYRDQITF